ncbi:DUF2752 domain-containing protein [Robertkochia aurantiaca]|uniref:DUF2752 domain-containing protein n=1 Tax=Robertkochia aurantiaca TaxID=2873700 RepID=UPI001CC92B91
MNKPVRFYRVVTVLLSGGYGWLFLNKWVLHSSQDDLIVCPTRLVWGVPCPSCGLTRSLLAFFRAEISEAMHWNPIGFPMLLLLLLLPLWLIKDLIMKRNSLYEFYLLFMNHMRRPYYAFAFGLIIFLTWGWNISKDL